MNLGNLKRRQDIWCTYDCGYETWYLIEIFTNINQIHDHDTRQSQCNFALPKPNTNFMKKTFGYRGSLVWNNLSVAVKSSETLNIFKNKIKRIRYLI